MSLADRAGSLNNLANAITTRYSLDGDRADLKTAIGYHKQALEVRPLPDRAGSLNNLANAIEPVVHNTIVEQLPVRSWVHLSCHDHQDLLQLFRSRFQLQDRSPNTQETIRMDLPNAEFAFLSASHTATGDIRAPNEGLHLAAAMQFAGFRGVVGSLWARHDIDGPDVAEAFCKFVFHDGEEGVYHKDAAKGLYKVTTALWKKNLPLDRWINFIYIGA